MTVFVLPCCGSDQIKENECINMADFQERMTERVRAVIVIANKILLINRIKTGYVYWVIPGGAVEPGENHEQAIERECLEELGVRVRVARLLLRRMSDKPGMEGRPEFFYLCSIVSGKVGTGQGPEFQSTTHHEGTYKIAWVDLKKLPAIDLKPAEIKNMLINL